MKHWLNYMAMMVLLLTAGRMAAQVPVLDSVCYGAVRNYGVTGETGSTYSWILTPPTPPGITLPSNADTVQIDWTYPAGVYELQAIQHALNGCDADAVHGLVYVFDAPDVYAGPDAMVCTGRAYSMIHSTEANTASLFWTTSGDGGFDDITLLHAEYHPGPGDILAGTVTLTLTGYGLVQDEEACAPSVSSMVLSVVDDIIPQFGPIGPFCLNSVPPALPDTSLEGITGYWIPPVINTGTEGTFPYLFEPDDPLQCGVPTTIYIIITDEIVPTFDTIGPLCINSIPPGLPDASLEGITGTWDPAVITTDVPGVFTYVFTPDDPGQCGVETSIDIAVVTEIQPLFDPIGPLCQNSMPPSLPGTSLNGIQGTWEPPAISTAVPGTFDFTFTPYPDQCGLDTTIQVTINPLVEPQFDPIGPLCQYSQAPPLPEVSLEGITGTWDPAWISTAVPGIFTFIFTPDDPSQCGLVTSIQVIVLPETVPEFEEIGLLCVNSVPPVLPDTSLNGVPGTWEPPVITTDLPGTFFFTFTPEENIPCVLPVSIAVVVTEEITPQFDTIGPLCQYSLSPALPDTSLEGISGTWVPPLISTDVTGVFTFEFTPDSGQCATVTSIDVVITDQIVPEFAPVGPLCQYSPPVTLPDTSLNGISGTWEPPVVNTDVPGSYLFTFTPDDPEQCGTEATMQIDVVTEIIPIFDPVGPLCQNSTPPDLPGVSLNGITGTWDPAVIGTSTPGTDTYTFTPDNPDQCGAVTTLDITVVPPEVPAFDPVGPFCLNSVPLDLPLVSINGITGTWDPPVINTTVAGTFPYTFMPDPTQCATDTTIQVIIGDENIPLFDQFGPFCQFSEPVTLPGTSLNGIEGTWDPPVTNTQVPGSFTFVFTPEPGQCAVNDTMIIIVEPIVTPMFNQIGPLSQNSVAPLLPPISLNGITGTWDPPFIDTSVPGIFMFVFTPDPGECAVSTAMNITVLFDVLQAITGAGGHCLTGAAIVPLDVNHFTAVAKFQLKLSYNVDKLLCEGYINPHPQLAANISGVVDQQNGIVTVKWEDTNPVTFPGLEKVCDLVFTPKEPGLGQLTWYTGPTESYFYGLDGQMIPAAFYTQDLLIYEPPEIILGTYKNVCIGDTVMIYGTATTTYPPLKYQWTLPDGTVQSADPYLVNITPDDGGDYVLLVTDSLGCTDQKSIHIIVNDNPIADFHDTDTLIVQPGYVLEAGSGMASYTWNTGETGESIVIDSTGLYRVTLVSAVGCIGTDSVYVMLSDEIPEGCMVIPNAFTPDGDGLNDSFKAFVNCPGITYFRMYIFNRWGQMIYETADISAGWDGRMNGEPVPGDVYVYKIVYRITGIGVQEEFVNKGNVLLLR